MPRKRISSPHKVPYGTLWLTLLVLIVFALGASNVYGQDSTALQLTAYNTDGANTGIARVTGTVTLHVNMKGAAGAVAWLVNGAGSISPGGIYQAPQTMPANSRVSIVASLISNPMISASYSLELMNAIPVIYNAYVLNGSLTAGANNTVTVHGAGFVPGSVVKIHGIPVPTTYVSSGYLLAQVGLLSSASATVGLSIVTGLPGGGTTPSFYMAVVGRRLVINAQSVDGTNTGTVRLGASATLNATVSGTATHAVVWTLRGAGSLSSAGFYQAPQVMPANVSVAVIAALATDATLNATYTMTLVNPSPVIYNAYVQGGSLLSGATNAVTVHGSGFMESTIVMVNSVAVPTVYESNGYLVAQVPIAGGSAGTLALTAQTPTPGGGTSAIFSAPIAPIWVNVSAMGDGGINPTSLPEDGTLVFASQVQGGGSSTLLPVTWTLTGGGTISSSGVYQAPDMLPSSSNVMVRATLVANPAISGAYHFYLVHASPVITSTSPAQVALGQMNPITVYGQHFVTQTTLAVDGVMVPTIRATASSLAANLAVSANQTAPLSIVAHNPDMNLAPSPGFSLLVGATHGALHTQVSLTPGIRVPQDFLGVSHEWTDPVWLMGYAAAGTNQAYVQMLSNLSLGASYPFSVRIGGGSTDTAGEPSTAIGTTLAQLAGEIPVRYLLGINLGANNLGLAKDQARFFLNALPMSSVQALEIGNEPDEYAWNGFRAASYSTTNYLSDYASWASSMKSLHGPGVTLMGPSWGEMGSLQSGLSAFEVQESSQVGVLSQHFYAGSQGSQSYFPPDFLLSPSSSQVGPAAVAAAVVSAHAAHQLFRIGEMNSIDNGGVEGISDSFSAALWSINTMFRFAGVGVDGVNWHGLSGCVYCPFTFSVQTSAPGQHTYALIHTNPLYYGWLFFQHAVTNGARLLPITMTSNANVSVWATLDDSGVVRVAVVNEDTLFAGSVQVSVPSYGVASVGTLTAPQYTSTSAVNLFGQTFDGSTDGKIMGSPYASPIFPLNGIYTVSVTPTSATLLTIQPQ